MVNVRPQRRDAQRGAHDPNGRRIAGVAAAQVGNQFIDPFILWTGMVQRVNEWLHIVIIVRLHK
jgi:hypothetical protein